jgi:hypothetical protein
MAAGAPVTLRNAARKGGAVADMTAITGGEAPTEAEHNLIITKINALLAVLRTNGILES